MDMFNKLAATVTKPTLDPTPLLEDQAKADPKPGPSSAPQPSLPRPWFQQVQSQEPIDITKHRSGPRSPPRLRAQFSDVSSDPDIEPTKAEKFKNMKTNQNTSPQAMSAPYLNHPLTPLRPKQVNLPLSKGMIKNKKNPGSLPRLLCIGM